MQFRDLIIPQLNVNDDKVTIENIRFKNLDFVEIGDVLYTVSTSKSIDDFHSDFAGYIVFFVKDGDELEIGKSAGIIFKDKSMATEKLAQSEKKTEVDISNVSKKALEYAKTLNFDISLIKKDGIIKVQDIDDYLVKHK
jgi:pyruvate/2-oxoglutarate dehydrogenase complex dihydrolipoamide acyltransferase (E2) component